MILRDELAALVSTEFRIPVAEIDFDRPLRDYGLDSLALVDAFFVMEEHFHVSLPSEAFEAETLGDMLRILDRLLGLRAAA